MTYISILAKTLTLHAPPQHWQDSALSQLAKHLRSRVDDVTEEEDDLVALVKVGGDTIYHSQSFELDDSQRLRFCVYDRPEEVVG